MGEQAEAQISKRKLVYLHTLDNYLFLDQRKALLFLGEKAFANFLWVGGLGACLG